MIVTAIMNLLKMLLLGIISLFPKLPDTSDLTNYVQPVFDLLRGMNQFISVSLVATCLVVLFVFANIEFVWGIIMWVVRKIPGVS